MSDEKPNLHMSFETPTGYILPPLQKKILLHLAKAEPQTVNETSKALKGSYKSFWVAHNSLKEKNLIQAVSIKTYRGRDYPCFWASSAGILVALFEGVKSDILLERYLRIYPLDRNIQAILELSPILGYESFKFAFYRILEKGQLEQADIAAVILTTGQRNFDASQVEPLLDILKKHPEQLESAKVYAKDISERMAKIQSILDTKKDAS